MASRLDPDASAEPLDAAALEDARRAIETQLSRSLPIVEVLRVYLGEVAARTGAEGIEDDLGNHEALFRITTKSPEAMDVLDTRSDVTGFLQRELATSTDPDEPVPETTIVATDMPPCHLGNEPLVYYVRTQV